MPENVIISGGFSIIKVHPQSHDGAVLLKTCIPRDMPEINFQFFEGTGEEDL
jgi:hypothetical protein